MTVQPLSTVPAEGERVAMLAQVAAERLDLADFLDSLDDQQWRTPSLCPGWSAHGVLAHLATSPRQRVLPTMWRIVKARGDYCGVEAALAREHAAATAPAELLALLRADAALDRWFAWADRLDPLVEVLVHGQDIVRPLGHHRPMPPGLALPALRHVWDNRFYRAARRFAGLRFAATDADFQAGAEGPLVRGPVGDILLLATGRRSGLTGLSGPGSDVAAARLS